VAFVRRAGEGAARRIRVALSAPTDIAAIHRNSDSHRPRRPWLPELPDRIGLAEFGEGEAIEGRLILGLADEPDRQRQVPVFVSPSDRGVLVVGAAGTGKTTALSTLSAQAPASVLVPADLEDAWDAVATLCEEPPAPGSVVVIDDLDALVAGYPHDYAAEFGERMERFVRGAGDHGLLVVAAAQRLTGTAGRIAELLPRRVLLGTASRSEYIALGGEASHHTPRQPAGRARVEGRAVQIAVAPPRPHGDRAESPPWFPDHGLTGFVARRSSATRATIAAWQERGIDVVRVADAAGERPGPSTLIVGDADDWQRHWQLLATVRDEHALVIHPSVATDFRALSADRALPPYCAPGRPRAWLCRDGLAPERITLPRAADVPAR
jgi:S-DNA-T family DNA segregation ATPase FtsK/SpoIIIE